MASKKRLLLLGGLRYLIPVINAAHELGYYVITCDYIPSNYAHKYSDEYHNVSIIDKEAVLSLAKRLQIDGIMSFAVDPGVVTSAYVADKMHLASPPYSSVCILQDKARFRQYLQEHGFNVPKSRGYERKCDAFSDIDFFSFPIIVKPVDSAGSKGVSRVDRVESLSDAIDNAIDNSLGRRFIIEEFIEKEGFSTDSDSFSVDGTLRFISFNDQRFDDEATNPYTPAAYNWPSTMPQNHQLVLKSEIERLITLLGLGTSLYNIETRVGRDGKPYIMELSPRGGGNRLSEVLYMATGINLIKNAVRAAMGDEISNDDLYQAPYNGFWSEIILHSDKQGHFSDIRIRDDIRRKYVVETDLWVSTGDTIHSFNGANDAIGTLVLKFDDYDTMSKVMNSQQEWLQVKVL